MLSGPCPCHKDGGFFLIWLEAFVGKDNLQHLSSSCLFLEFLIFGRKVDMFAVVLPLRQSLFVINF